MITPGLCAVPTLDLSQISLCVANMRVYGKEVGIKCLTHGQMKPI